MPTYYKIVESTDCNFDIELISKRTTNSNWSAIYLQTTIEHALNYLEHKAYQTNNKLDTELNHIFIEDKIFGNY